jgi:2-dehydropantoate 2-reductase
MQGKERPRVVVIGAGAIGSAVAGWIAPHYSDLSLLARGETAKVIREKGMRMYLKGQRAQAVPIPMKVIESLAEIPASDILVIAVKNYDLDAVAKEMRGQIGNREPIVVGLQNGVENQQILPQYFAKPIYGVVCFNAWRDAPGEVGHEAKGLIILGTPNNVLKAEMREVASVFQPGLDCTITDRLQDAAHCKLVINQVNALMTLVGFQKRPIESFNVLVHMTMSLMWEGVRLLRAAGFKEHPLGNIPSWRTIEFGAKLPAPLTAALYRFSAKELGLNSMSQDVFSGRAYTELESLNGYMLRLAEKVGFPAPINETIYEVAKERLGPGFKPLPEKELWSLIQKKMKKK